ncbi:MAG TPA: nickel-dependent hydrogenase large subunit [Tepidisphaeraceae bacterium]|nr:nickel-dependent hydrogenase large subunit [Tepidisphaeraceae bacterium]
MPTTFKISPVTRIEGHLDVELTVDTVNGQQQVVDARCTGPMFRGFEKILLGRNPRDATHLTQRICGVCPVSHAMASSLALEAAFNVAPPANGRIIRNLVLGANFIQSHVLHFYHLAALDYIDTTGTTVEMSPWKPHFTLPDMITGATAQTLVDHYVQALAIRRKAHQMGAIFAGRLPGVNNFVPGGSSETVDATAVTNFTTLLTAIRSFIDNTYIPDAQAVADAFSAYKQIGRGAGNLLAFGVFDLDTAGSTKLLARGRYTNSQLASVDVTQIKEYVQSSWYSSASGLNPSVGATDVQYNKSGAYSFIKAPRYQDLVHEVGPLARMWVNGDYRTGISVIDRIVARALETKKIADAMVGWLSQLVAGGSVYTNAPTPASATAIGLTEAARGALGHWVSIGSSVLSGYQIITPTAWNCSPRDDAGQPGAMEQALVGTPITDIAQPVEALRVIHSFDPCLACSVHMARPGRNAEVVVRG